MIKIFAKYNTDEKVAIYCHRDQISFIQEKLNRDYGGSWCLVDECHTGREILKFNDSQIYRGFEPATPHNFRYSQAIKKF